MRAVLLMLGLVLIFTAFVMVLFPSQKHLRPRDPTLFDIWDETKPLHKIDTADLKVLRQEPFIVYFPHNLQQQAEEVARALSQGWRIVKEQLAFDLGAFSVVLVPTP